MTAQDFIESSSFVWHQRFRLDDGAYTPGASDVEWLWEAAGLPLDLAGMTVLDIGTANGGVAFEAERRGAGRVVAVDIYPPNWFGFTQTRQFLGSSVEFVQASVYALPEALGEEQFDVVVFWGVLYHLRHPLLALDVLRTLTSGEASIETQIVSSIPDEEAEGYVQFHRKDELGRDASNWFAPSVATLASWCESSGLEPEVLLEYPAPQPSRCIVKVTPAQSGPEFIAISYERPLRVAHEPELLAEPPLPPYELRVLVGPTEPEAFDNATGDLIYPELDVSLYEAVFELGCGCGRVARQLLKQRQRPNHYLGVDLHRGMVDWCNRHLTPFHPGFRFLHHDVHNSLLNPNAAEQAARLPAPDHFYSLMIAHSVFTHLVEWQAEHYLAEAARLLAPHGRLVSTWFLFDRRDYDLPGEGSNALYARCDDPSAAVIFAGEWVTKTAAAAGLKLVDVERPLRRGSQWRLMFALADARIPEVELALDAGSVGPSADA